VPGDGGIETLAGLIEQVAPPVDMLRLTVPLNPLIAFNVTAEVVFCPVLTVWI
jgi:hypothetical protein